MNPSEANMILEALKTNSDKVDKLSSDLGDFAKAVHELALSTRYISKDVENLQLEITEIKKIHGELRDVVQSHQSTVNLLNKIGDIVLKWLVPLSLVGSVVGGVLYTYAGK